MDRDVSFAYQHHIVNVPAQTTSSRNYNTSAHGPGKISVGVYSSVMYVIYFSIIYAFLEPRHANRCLHKTHKEKKIPIQ